MTCTCKTKCCGACCDCECHTKPIAYFHCPDCNRVLGKRRPEDCKCHKPKEPMIPVNTLVVRPQQERGGTRAVLTYIKGHGGAGDYPYELEGFTETFSRKEIRPVIVSHLFGYPVERITAADLPNLRRVKKGLRDAEI